MRVFSSKAALYLALPTINRSKGHVNPKPRIEVFHSSTSSLIVENIQMLKHNVFIKVVSDQMPFVKVCSVSLLVSRTPTSLRHCSHNKPTSSRRPTSDKPWTDVQTWPIFLVCFWSFLRIWSCAHFWSLHVLNFGGIVMCRSWWSQVIPGVPYFFGRGLRNPPKNMPFTLN